MRAVVQRTFAASVQVDGCLVGKIDRGLVAFVGAGKEDTDADALYIADKITGLRVFQDDQGKMSRSVADVACEVLVVSQFTVHGDMRRGRRPSFDGAMEPVEAERLVQRVVERIRSAGVPVSTGQFRAMMRVLVDNDGPVTILIDSKKQF